MHATYWPDSTVRLSWYNGDGPGFVTGSEAMTQRGAVTVHHMFSPVVHLHGDKTYVEASAAIWSAMNVDDKRGDVISYWRLSYWLERRDGEWRILSLDAIYEYTTLTPSVPGQTIEIPARRLAKYRPSYALIARNVAQSGQSVSDDELGDDRDPRPSPPSTPRFGSGSITESGVTISKPTDAVETRLGCSSHLQYKRHVRALEKKRRRTAMMGSRLQTTAMFVGSAWAIGYRQIICCAQ